MSSQKSKKVKIFKFIVFCIFLVLLGILTVKFYPFFRDISTIEGQEAFKTEIESMGFAGMLLLATLQFSQIFLVVLPGEPFEILAGMCYGPIGGMFFIFITAFLSTTAIYFIVKKYKEKYLYNFFEKEKVQKFLSNKWIKNPKKTQILLTILFFIPASPKDLLTYCGALLNIRPLKFILIATFARFPSVICFLLTLSRSSSISKTDVSIPKSAIISASSRFSNNSSSTLTKTLNTLFTCSVTTFLVFVN